MSTTPTKSTRPKCRLTPPPPPSPKILQFPRIRRRTRTRRTHRINPFLLLHRRQPSHHFHSPVVSLNHRSTIEKRIRVEEEGDAGDYLGGGAGEDANRLAEEKWMFQAEILRAECNFLRMEREFALKKLERNKVKMERTLRSAVQTLVAGRKKIFEGKNASTVLEKEIADLSEKLEELHRSSRVGNTIVRNCNNFDKKACLLQRRMGKLGELPNENSLDGSQGLDDDSNSSLNTTHDNRKQNCVSINKSTDDWMVTEDNRCSGHCKAIVHRIVEQVRAETEQWSQMQEMLERVRGEMEELQASHDFWEKRAHNSAHDIQSLKLAVEEWQGKALGYETKANELEAEVSVLQEKLCKAKEEFKPAQNRRIQSKENQNVDENKDSPAISLGKRLAKERKMLLLGLKERPEENSWDGRRRKAYSSSSGIARAALQDIGNLSRQN